MALTPGQLTALRNLARKQAGEDVDWINIADARALTELGLAERNRGGWEITPAGLAALPEARRTLFHAEQCRLAVKQSLIGEQGSLRIGFVGSATHTLLPRILQPFAKRFPKVDLSLEESWSTDLLARLDQGVSGLLLACAPNSDYCKARADNITGYLARADFWGVFPNEVVK